MCQPVVHRVCYSHMVKENAAQRSDAHSQPAHRFSGWKSPCAQRGQIWYHNTAGKGGSKGQYWYGRHFCLGKSLRECKQLLVIVWGCIQSQVLPVCVTGIELECTWSLSYMFFFFCCCFMIHTMCQMWPFHMFTLLGIEYLTLLCTFTKKVWKKTEKMQAFMHSHTKCEFEGSLHFWTHSRVPSHHESMCSPKFIDFSWRLFGEED